MQGHALLCLWPKETDRERRLASSRQPLNSSQIRKQEDKKQREVSQWTQGERSKPKLCKREKHDSSSSRSSRLRTESNESGRDKWKLPETVVLAGIESSTVRSDGHSRRHRAWRIAQVDGYRRDQGEGGGTLMIKLFAMAAEAGERSHEGGPQRSKTIMVRSDILRLPISDRPTAGQTRCVLRSGRRRVPDANNSGRCPILPSYYVLAYVQISFLLKCYPIRSHVHCFTHCKGSSLRRTAKFDADVMWYIFL
jgi:hypothetical protein